MHDERAEMTAEEGITIMVERIVCKFRPQRVLLFGSHARGTARPDSDIDLIVVFPSVADEYALTAEIRRSLSDLPFAKDVLVTTPDEIERRLALPGDVLHYAIPEARELYAEVDPVPERRRSIRLPDGCSVCGYWFAAPPLVQQARPGWRIIDRTEAGGDVYRAERCPVPECPQREDDE